jgi:hypothetical protein
MDLANDSAFAWAFLSALERPVPYTFPTYTVQLVNVIDQRELELFDTLLGTATRSPEWNFNFTNLIHYYGNPFMNGVDGYKQEFKVLAYGVFSNECLRAFGDQFLVARQQPFPVGHWVNTTPGRPRDAAIMNAIARRPDFARTFLFEAPGDSNPVGNGALCTYGSRLCAITQQYLGVPGAAAALLNLLEVAAASGNLHTVLEKIGHIPTSYTLPDAVGAWINQSLTPHLLAGDGLVTDVGDTSAGPSWQERVFWFAETDSAGRTNKAWLANIVNSVDSWGARNVPTLQPGTVKGFGPGYVWNPATCIQWAKTFGSMQALAMVPVLKKVYNGKAADTTAFDTLANVTTTAIGAGLALIPGLGDVAASGISFLLGEIPGAIDAGVNAAAAIAQDKNLMSRYRPLSLGAQMASLAYLFRQDPRWVPSKIRNPPLAPQQQRTVGAEIRRSLHEFLIAIANESPPPTATKSEETAIANTEGLMGVLRSQIELAITEPVFNVP